MPKGTIEDFLALKQELREKNLLDDDADKKPRVVYMRKTGLRFEMSQALLTITLNM